MNKDHPHLEGEQFPVLRVRASYPTSTGVSELRLGDIDLLPLGVTGLELRIPDDRTDTITVSITFTVTPDIEVPAELVPRPVDEPGAASVPLHDGDIALVQICGRVTQSIAERTKSAVMERFPQLSDAVVVDGYPTSRIDFIHPEPARP